MSSSSSRPIKRTYSRQNRSTLPSSPLSSPSRPKKRSYENESEDKTPVKRLKLVQAKQKPKKLVQLHLSLSDTPQSTLRTCPLCSLSYTRGTPDDESLHRSHCARVRRGMEWGKDEERAQFEVIQDSVYLPDGRKGRIVSVPLGNTGGKLTAKMTALLSTINLALSSPALTQEMLQASKAYLFLLSTPLREKIAGCVITQRITSAFDVDTSSDALSLKSTSHPTPLGISRLFVPSAHRRAGIATLLLDAAAETFIHGCPLDPSKGQVAFTQPTESGEAVMKKWGKGGCRVYEE